MRMNKTQQMQISADVFMELKGCGEIRKIQTLSGPAAIQFFFANDSSFFNPASRQRCARRSTANCMVISAQFNVSLVLRPTIQCCCAIVCRPDHRENWQARIRGGIMTGKENREEEREREREGEERKEEWRTF
ncbi:hypothetical protein Tcan_10573 [Toxocara canis]|uniref:Uncharacterized protein n=1 Tax=Toxocara canis TaxID=6265 RepID=A0A0B2UYI2_TOXCA|nr:hypothetical protein Tcan_10573 [Toxocara canis]